MTEINIKRVSDTEYELIVDGGLVETYQQSKMTHPWDWSEDAISAGASDMEIRSRDYEYKDER